MITTIQGDATSPRPDGETGVIIAHLCNCLGAWGAGFVLAVNKVSKAPEAAYRALAADYGAGKMSGKQIPLGNVQFVECCLDGCDGAYIVANMIAQKGISKGGGGVLVDYTALRHCLEVVFTRAAALQYEVHIPRGMGSGLAGGDINTILTMIEEVANETGANVTLWEFTDTNAASYVAPAPDPNARNIDMSDDAADIANAG